MCITGECDRVYGWETAASRDLVGVPPTDVADRKRNEKEREKRQKSRFTMERQRYGGDGINEVKKKKPFFYQLNPSPEPLLF